MHPWRLLAALLVAAAPFAPLQAAPADEVKALLEQGRAAEAYEAAKRHPQELGSPEFDFYFGVAAVDSGRAGEGVLALERYVANFPDNASARLELARGYFVLGDDARAREEFDAVLKTSPPAGVRANVERFLDAIRAREAAYRTTTGFYLEAGLGYDSNVNGGVGSASLTLPGLGPVTLLTGTETADSFAHFAAGARISHPVAPGVALFGNAAAELKAHRHDTAFDQGNFSAAGGVSYLQDKNLWRATVSHGVLTVDDGRFRSITGIAGEVSHQFDELQSLSASLQVATLDYAGANAVRDSTFQGAGIGWRRAFIGALQPLVSVSLNYGEEDNRRGRPDLGRALAGGRVALALTPAPRWAVAVGATYQRSAYDAPDPLFATTRKDDYYGADASVSYALTREWSVRAEYQYARNRSNVALYEYDRNLVALKLRYDFK